MAIATRQGGGYIDRPRPSGLADVIDIILDKGLVIDAYVRVALVGIELLTIDARIVIASVDTYLRFAEATNRLDLKNDGQSEGLPQLMESLTSGGAKSKTQGALEGVKEKIFGSDDDDDDGDDNGDRQPARKRTARKSSNGRSSSSSRKSSNGRSSSSSARKRSRSSS